jgi:hypothetical protein
MKTKILPAIISVLLTMSVNAQIIHVPADRLTIQAGIIAADNGDTVLVAHGTYYENITFRGKAITVASQFLVDGDTNHISNTIISGSQAAYTDSAAVVMFCYGEDTTSILCGFTITGGSGMFWDYWGIYGGGGIACSRAGAKIVHNIITDNEVTDPVFVFGGGIACDTDDGEGWIIIEDNVVKNNHVIANSYIASSGGIYVGINARIRNNIIEGNLCSCLDGRADGGGIRWDSEPSLLKTVLFDNNIIRNNTVQGYSALGAGVMVYKTTSTISNNIITNNTTEAENDGRGAGIYILQSQGKVHIYNNTVSNNSLVSDYKAFGSGISTLNTNAKVIIEYNRILNNSISASENCFGGGIMIAFPLNPFPIIISKNQISGNTGDLGDSYGGGVGLSLDLESEVFLNGNVITDNMARNGGGIYMKDVYKIEFINNVFSCDTALSYGGAICCGIPPQELPAFSKEQKTYNRSLKSEKPAKDDEHPCLINNTFTGNRGFTGGAIFSNYGGSFPVIINSLFWDNDASEARDIYQTGSPDLPVYHCNIDTNEIAGTWSGEGNINEDPRFIDPANGNFCLDSCNSPCAGAGIDSLFIDNYGWCYAPQHDIRNVPRPLPEFTMPDMGAYEVDYCVGVEELQVADCRLQVFPNPVSGIAFIKYQLPVESRQSAVGSHVEMAIYNIAGEKIRTLVDEEQASGENTFCFDASPLPDGIYFVRLQAGNALVTKKSVVMR